MAKAIEVHITAPSRDAAETLARALVEERLAACVNIVPGVRSVYRWEGKLVEDEEVLCLAKTQPELFQPLAARIKALHPYEVPEILAFEVNEGSAEYLAWLGTATTR